MAHVNHLSVYILKERPSLEQMVLHSTGREPFPTPIRDALTALIRPALTQAGLGSWDGDTFLALPRNKSYAATVFHVANFEAAETAIDALTSGTSLSGTYRFHREVLEMRDAGAPWKAIEIYYDIAAIPVGQGDPLDFRNAAMERIEAALEDAGAGAWTGADSGMGEVNFGFEVEDFEAAEAIVRRAVAGTPFAGIREIARKEG